MQIQKIPQNVTGEYIHHDYFYKQVQNKVHLNILLRTYTCMIELQIKTMEIITKNKSRALTLYGVIEGRRDGTEGVCKQLGSSAS